MYLRDVIQIGFANLSAEEAINNLQRLTYVYDHLRPVLGCKWATDPLAIGQIPALAEETYWRGLSVLSDALQLMTAIRSPHNERLENEVVRLEQ